MTSAHSLAIAGRAAGPMPADWRGELSRKGIEVFERLLREKAVADLQKYAASHSLMYDGLPG